MRDTERDAETQAEGEGGSMQGARHGSRSRDSRIMPWAKGRHQTTEPPRDPQNHHLNCKFLGHTIDLRNQISVYVV